MNVVTTFISVMVQVTREVSRPVNTGDSMQFLWRESCNFKIARVNQVRFSVRFVAAISQGFRTCLKLVATSGATKIASSCRDKNRLCKRALKIMFNLKLAALVYNIEADKNVRHLRRPQ